MHGKIQQIENKKKSDGTPFRRVQIAGQWASFWESAPLALGQEIDFDLVHRGKFVDLKLAAPDTPSTDLPDVDYDDLQERLTSAGVDLAEAAAVVRQMQGLITYEAALVVVAKNHGVAITSPAPVPVVPAPARPDDPSRPALHAMDVKSLEALFQQENQSDTNPAFLGQISNQIRYARLEALLEAILAQCRENHEVAG